MYKHFADATAGLDEHVMERKGCPLHYWEGGPEDRPLVVLTHGLCVDHRSWKYQVPMVAKDYRVLVWDVRGHGLSQPVGEAYTTPLAVEDLLALVDQLGYEKAMFLGHSNGTYIHQELAFRHPERVTAMVIVDGTCITWPHSAFDYWLLRSSPKMMALIPYETLKKASLPYISDRKDVQDYTYEAYSMLSKHDYLALSEGAFTGLHSEPNYRITQPLLLVHGDHDRTGDIAKIAPKWAAREPNCRYVVIPNASHFAIMDNSEFFNKLLMEFLAHFAI
jgi:pimeloyl-ACP methyl ester carboxylesterase